MHWTTSLLPAGSPFVLLRKDFERQLGLEPEPTYAAMSVEEYSDRWVLNLDVPGISHDEITISWNDGSLVIEGERKTVPVEGAKEIFNDRSFTRFRRVLRVREAIDPAAVEAALENGVLTLTIPRVPEPKPTKIAIRNR